MDYFETLTKIHGQFKEGIYGGVFFQAEYAIKVFKRHNDKPEEEIRRIYHGEINAYKIAQNNHLTAEYVTHFKSIATVGRLFNNNNVDISHEFYTDLAYSMKRISGEEEKVGRLTGPLQDDWRRIRQRFTQADITCLDDCSVFMVCSTICNVIDLSTYLPDPIHEEFVDLC